MSMKDAASYCNRGQLPRGVGLACSLSSCASIIFLAGAHAATSHTRHPQCLRSLACRTEVVPNCHHTYGHKSQSQSHELYFLETCCSESPRPLCLRLYLYPHSSKSAILARLWIESAIHRILLFAGNSCQFLRTPRTLQRCIPDQLEVIAAIVETFVVGDADLVRDKDLGPGSHDGRPEYGHGRTHDGEVDFEAGDDEDFGVPPCKIETLRRALAVFKGAPKAEDSHEYDTASVSDDAGVFRVWTYIEPRANSPVMASTCFRLRSFLKYSVIGTRNIAMSNAMFVAANASIVNFASLIERYPKP